MLIGVEKIDGLTQSLGCHLFAWPLHIADRIELIAVCNSRIANAVERAIEFLFGHGKCQVLSTLCAPCSDLDDKLRGNAKHRKRFSLAVVLESDNPSVERYAPGSIVDSEDDVIKFDCHTGLCLVDGGFGRLAIEAPD
jgi:hypothetical protein